MGLKKNGFRFLVFWYFGILGHIDIYGFKLFGGFRFLVFWYFRFGFGDFGDQTLGVV